MPAPTATLLLDAWERGRVLPSGARAVHLACAAVQARPADGAQWSVGEVDQRLLALRETLFGPHCQAVATCPACGERLEFAFTTADVRSDATFAEPAAPLALDLGDQTVHLRLPTPADLDAVAAVPDLEAARDLLLSRCLLDAEPRALSPAALTSIDAALQHADPQAVTQIALSCPACAQSWVNLLDIGGFLWSELEAWANALLRDVHTLASAYGWSEAEIVALTPARRRVYRELIAS